MSRRDDVLAWAETQLGPPTPEKVQSYWTLAGLPGRYEPLAWCGIFALAALHKGGLALDEHWKLGAGFILQPPHPLPVTHDPKPGDIGYKANPWQHHFIVESVEGGRVHSIDGNAPDVRRVTRVIDKSLTFYSIEPLLAAVSLPSPSVPPPARPLTPFDTQRAVNAIILAHPLGAPSLLQVDGVIGPKSQAAIAWCHSIGEHP